MIAGCRGCADSAMSRKGGVVLLFHQKAWVSLEKERGAEMISEIE